MRIQIRMAKTTKCKMLPMVHFHRLLSQGYIALRLEKSFKKFYGRYQDLIEKYQRSINVMVNDSFPG